MKRIALIAGFAAVLALLCWTLCHRPSSSRGDSARERLEDRTFEPRATDERDDGKGGGIPLADQVRLRKPTLRAALDRLMVSWKEEGYRERLAGADRDIFSLRPGEPGGYINEDLKAPSAFRRAVQSFNTAVWQDGAGVLALFEVLEEEPDEERRRVAFAYFNAFEARSRNVAAILSRDAAEMMVSKLTGGEDPFFWHIVLEPFRLAARLERQPGFDRTAETSRLLSEQSALNLFEWYRARKTLLAGTRDIEAAEMAICDCGHYGKDIVEFLLEEARQVDRQGAANWYFARSLCRGARDSDDLLAAALELSSIQDGMTREILLRGLASNIGVQSGSSPNSQAVFSLIQAAAIADDEAVRAAAFEGMIVFDRPDAQALIEAKLAVASDPEYVGLSNVLVEQLRKPDSHGFVRTGQEIVRRCLGDIRCSSHAGERRAATYRVLCWYYASEARRGMSESRKILRQTLTDMKTSGLAQVVDEASRLQKDAAFAELIR